MQERDSGATASGFVLILITLVGWSSVPLFLKHFTGYLEDGWTTNGWRYGMSALFWAPVLIYATYQGRAPKALWKAALVPALFNLPAQISFAWAPYYINAGMLAFMLRLQIVFVAVASYMLFPAERRVLRSPSYVIGVATVFGGMVGLLFLGTTRPEGRTAFGIGLGIFAGIFYGAYSMAVRKYVTGMSAVLAFAAISLYTALGLIPVMLLMGKDHGAGAWRLSWAQFGLLFASALAGIALTHVTYYAAIARIGLALSVGIILLQPFLASAGAYFLFGEQLTAAQWASGIIAMCGAGVMVKAQWSGKKPVEALRLTEATQSSVGFRT